MGLPLAKALTEAMSGQLTASSVLGEGSAFTVSLPRAPDVIHAPPQDTVPASPARPLDLAELGELLDSSATPAQDHARTATLAAPA